MVRIRLRVSVRDVVYHRSGYGHGIRRRLLDASTKNAEENPFLTRRTNPPFRLKQE